MSRKQLKFILGPAIIVVTLVWIGAAAFDSTMAYYQTVSEVYAMERDNTLEGKRLKVMGEVIPGTLKRTAEGVSFVIVDKEDPEHTMTVNYVGKNPVPDTLRDYAEAVADGEYAGDGVFTATQLQAKCASKYERELEAGVIPETTQLDAESGF